MGVAELAIMLVFLIVCLEVLRFKTPTNIKIICKCKCDCDGGCKQKNIRLTKRISIKKTINDKKGDSGMLEIQADQYGLISYAFADDAGEPIDVASISVVSSSPEFLEVVAEEKTELGIYPYRLNWIGEGVGTLDLSAERMVGDTAPIVDQEAFSTIPNVAEGVVKNVVINEL